MSYNRYELVRNIGEGNRSITFWAVGPSLFENRSDMCIIHKCLLVIPIPSINLGAKVMNSLLPPFSHL